MRDTRSKYSPSRMNAPWTMTCVVPRFRSVARDTSSGNFSRSSWRIWYDGGLKPLYPLTILFQ